MSSERDESSDSSGDESEPTIAQDIVVTKYGMAAEIVNAVLKEVIGQIEAGKVIGDICDFGDDLLNKRTAKVFKKEKDVKKGVAFPTCISVNHCICHFSPLRSEPETKLADGDMVKIDLGAHIDGFIATVAHTLVVGANKENKVTGRQADVITAAYNAMEVAIRMLRPGQHKNMEITDTIGKVVDVYNCKPIENMISHQLKRNRIDGEKQIIQNPGEKQRQDMEKCEIGQHEVYAIDVLASTGEGKAKEGETRTTVYKKANDIIYQLKMKASRVFFSDAINRFGQMPFTLRAFEDEKKAKLGTVECEKHALLKPYMVLYENRGELVAQFKATVLVMPNALLKITGTTLDTDIYQSDLKIEDEKLCKLLSTSLRPNKKKPKKKKEEANASQA